MAIHETIIDLEDREFVTSLGNWTGDAVWLDVASPLGFGVAALYLPPGENQKNMQLAFPNIEPGAGKTHRFTTNLLSGVVQEYIKVEWELTDGIYTFSGSVTISESGFLQTIDEYIDIPGDFDISSTTLTITVTAPDHTVQLALYSDRYSISWESEKVDHLPLMGVH